MADTDRAGGADGAWRPTSEPTDHSRQPGQDQQKQSGHLDLKAGDLWMPDDVSADNG